ncbi:geranylgeranyl diphosphate synthase, type I [Streptomyces melanosporofaciens]|uniref:Geranylgeranyl diphosphate synthase, type I n=2 Tax=Streptomyces melanosporofaciens TaxID=67327 RepID=A0A1H5BEH3_STRMJ|nr:polyprenyl synthetase family protein [Streptomyces melanosporofaciens]SED52648.1 geranylgeranyl diphosphate synthase, type I [Streptomyces melanosporofaciens]
MTTAFPMLLGAYETTATAHGTTATADEPTATAGEILVRCRELVRPALAETVGRLHPWVAEMAAYSFGWCDVGGTPAEGAGGKGVRQALAVLCAEAAGASGEAAVAGAVAVELVHTFSLLHDDIMDGDQTRRTRPTVWKAYGTGPAVLAGDALFALAVEALAAVPGAGAAAAVRRLSVALGDLVHGQADDLLFESRPWTGPAAVGPEEYRTMAEHKTGALLGCAAALGAALAGAPETTAATLDRAGRHMGVAFQVADDLLGIWGDPAVTGKPVHRDLRQRKKTFPVLAALSARDTSAAGQLATLLEESPDTPDDATTRRAADLIEQAGGRSAALVEADRHITAVERCLDGLPLVPRASAELHTLLGFLARRDI